MRNNLHNLIRFCSQMGRGIAPCLFHGNGIAVGVGLTTFLGGKVCTRYKGWEGPRSGGFTGYRFQVGDDIVITHQYEGTSMYNLPPSGWWSGEAPEVPARFDIPYQKVTCDITRPTKAYMRDVQSRRSDAEHRWGWLCLNTRDRIERTTIHY